MNDRLRLYLVRALLEWLLWDMTIVALSPMLLLFVSLRLITGSTPSLRPLEPGDIPLILAGLALGRVPGLIKAQRLTSSKLPTVLTVQVFIVGMLGIMLGVVYTLTGVSTKSLGVAR